MDYYRAANMQILLVQGDRPGPGVGQMETIAPALLCRFPGLSGQGVGTMDMAVCPELLFQQKGKCLCLVQ